MKKTLAVLLGAGVVLLSAACGSSDEASDSTEDTTSTTTSASAESGTPSSPAVNLGDSYEDNCAAMLRTSTSSRSGVRIVPPLQPLWPKLSSSCRNGRT